MKRVAVIVAVLILILAVSAAEVTDYSYKKVEPTDDIIETIGKIIRVEPAWDEPAEGYIEVTIHDVVVAQIPEDSKFADIVIHDQCLPYQYGTTAWYDCEVPLQ